MNYKKKTLTTVKHKGEASLNYSGYRFHPLSIFIISKPFIVIELMENKHVHERTSEVGQYITLVLYIWRYQISYSQNNLGMFFAQLLFVLLSINNNKISFTQ